MKNSKRITIIADSFPPTIGGIGDYALKLGEYWPKDDFSVQFLAFRNASQSQQFLKGLDVAGFNSSPGSLSGALQNSDLVVLNYNPIAFSRIGFLLWMIHELRAWKRQYKKGKLLLIAHELWSNPPVTSKFYIPQLLSQYTSKQIAKLSDKIICVTQRHSEKLSFINRPQDIVVLPVPSNIASPINPKDWMQRRPGSFALFGLNHTRLWALELFFPYLLDWAKNGLLSEFIIIGPHQGKWEQLEKQLLDQLAKYCVVKICGILSADSISSILNDCQFGLTSQTEDNILKSGSFMAMASHGCVVLSPFAKESAAVPMRLLQHPTTLMTKVLETPQRDSLLKWYQANCSWDIVIDSLIKHTLL